MSPNYRCETGGVETLHNYNLSPTVNSINDDKLYTQNNLDFSGFSSSNKNNFSKKYSNILNELSPSLNKNSNVDFKQRLNLMRIQSKLETNTNERPISPSFNNKIQDIKYNYFTQEKKDNDYLNYNSPLRTMGNFKNGCKYIKNKY